MAIDYLVTDTELSDIADAIRAKGGTSASISFPNGFTTAIAAIPTGITPTGTKQISISGAGTVTEDVTNYANAEITTPAGTAGTPTATKGAVSNHSIDVTPSVTNTTGFITGSTKTGTAVNVSASELVSGSETKTANGTYDVTNLAELIVNVSGGGGASTVKCGEITATATGMQTINTQYTGSGFPLAFAIIQMGGVTVNTKTAGYTVYVKIKTDTTAPSQYASVYSCNIRSYGTGSSGQTVEKQAAIIFNQGDALNNANLCAIMSSADTLKVYFGDSQTSFKTNVRYCWVVAYSA